MHNFFCKNAKNKNEKEIFSHIFPVYLLGGKMPNFGKKKKIGEKKITRLPLGFKCQGVAFFLTSFEHFRQILQNWGYLILNPSLECSHMTQKIRNLNEKKEKNKTLVIN